MSRRRIRWGCDVFLMYVDESGDPGLQGSPTRYFVLSGVVIHELAWRETLERLIAFRRGLRVAFGLKLREEIHAARMITNPGELGRIERYDRLAILRHFADALAALPDLSVINIVVDKKNKPADYAVHDRAWQALLQRFENTIGHRNFPGPSNADERGMIIPDGEPQRALRTMVRKMRRYNPVPGATGMPTRNLPLAKVIEDPIFRDSRDSLLIQAADLCAFLLYQKLEPNSFMKRKGGRAYFGRLGPILCRHASPRDADGIVRL